jgi:hypothetical protein
MSVSYISHLDYINAPEGLETVSLLGNSMRLSNVVIAGATTLPVIFASGGGTSTMVDLYQFDKITIYDGLSTETVMVAADTTFPATSIPLLSPGFQYAHAQYTPCSSRGILGDIGSEILKASSILENITKQSLWSTSQTEILRMPSMRASIDNQQVLTFRTKQYPITAINTLSIGANLNVMQPYDPTQAIIDANELVTVPQLIAQGSGSSTYSIVQQQVSRTMNAYLQVGYTAGYTALTMPDDVRDAAILLTNSLLSRRDNPTGADQISEGKGSIVTTLRGDQSGDSLLVKQAKFILSNYTLRTF